MTPGSVNVDWLDPARESCLIDGVRYTREGTAGSEVALVVGDYMAMEWSDLAQISQDVIVGRIHRAIEADRRKAESDPRDPIHWEREGHTRHG